MYSIITLEDGDEVLEKEILHDKQTEMERIGSIHGVLASNAHVKRYFIASDDGNDTLNNQLRVLKNTLHSRVLQGMLQTSIDHFFKSIRSVLSLQV